MNIKEKAISIHEMAQHDLVEVFYRSSKNVIIARKSKNSTQTIGEFVGTYNQDATPEMIVEDIRETMRLTGQL